MTRLGGILMTGYGPVKVSEREGEMLQLRYEVDRLGPHDDPAVERWKKRADLLIADCERVARFNAERKRF